MLIYENRLPKMKFFLVPSNFIITKNHAAYPGIGYLTKSISKVYGRETAIPTVWELKKRVNCILKLYRLQIKQGFINVTRKELV